MTSQNVKYHFCTITTSDHLFKVFALRDSLRTINDHFTLHVLVIDDHNLPDASPNIIYYSLEHLDSNLAIALRSKYAGERDKLRWVLKPVLLNWLLNQIEKLIYLDNDMACFSSFAFLFDQLNSHTMLLTPHHYPRNPKKEQQWLEANFKVGLYNAGFIAANREASGLLNWWAECCLYRCEKNSIRGLFDDQKYLDLLPIMDQRVKVLEHKGCNVASWNEEECRRVAVDGNILIDGHDPIVFIHFNKYTLLQIPLTDQRLQHYYDLYNNLVLKHNPNWQKPLQSSSWLDRIKLAIWNALNSLNNRNNHYD